MKEITEYTISIHDRRLAKVTVMLYVRQTIVTYQSLLPVIVYVQDTGCKDHQIDAQQEKTKASLSGVRIVQMSNKFAANILQSLSNYKLLMQKRGKMSIFFHFPTRFVIRGLHVNDSLIISSIIRDNYAQLFGNVKNYSYLCNVQLIINSRSNNNKNCRKRQPKLFLYSELKPKRHREY